MIKRTLIVLASILCIVFVPYFVCDFIIKFYELDRDMFGGYGIIWLFGYFAIGIPIVLGIMVYGFFMAIYKYIKG